jgi:hypothetical protein
MNGKSKSKPERFRHFVYNFLGYDWKRIRRFQSLELRFSFQKMAGIFVTTSPFLCHPDYPVTSDYDSSDRVCFQGSSLFHAVLDGILERCDAIVDECSPLLLICLRPASAQALTGDSFAESGLSTIVSKSSKPVIRASGDLVVEPAFVVFAVLQR